MSAPIPALDPELYPDSLIIFAPVVGKDIDAGVVQTPGAGVAIQGSVQDTTQIGAEMRRFEPAPGGGNISGLSYKNILFPTDPQIGGPDIRIHWVANAYAGTFATPRILETQGASTRAGLELAWRVTVLLRQ